MDLENCTTLLLLTKLPILKQVEYASELRIEQYFQVQDYALWDVIENGNSFKPVAQTTTNVDGTSTSLIPGPVTTEEKGQKTEDLRQELTMANLEFCDKHNMVAYLKKPSGSEGFQEIVYFLNGSHISPNEVNTAYGVSTANTQVARLALNQPNGSQLVYEDLEQIHEDDLEEMDLKWQLALLSMRTRKGPRNQDNRSRNQDSSRRTINVEEISSKAMLAIDGAGFDWSYMADDEVPTNMALMAFSDSEVHNDKTCSKTCLKSFETLKTQLDDLRIEFNKSEFNLATYKRGLASVEEQLVFYKKNEVLFCEQLVVLKRDISYKDSEISVLKSELEKLKQEKESNQLKIENFDNSSKKEFQQPEFEGYGPKTSKSANCNYHQRERMVSGNNYTRVNFNYSAKKAHPSAHRNIVPKAGLMKTGLRPLNTARPVNTAHPKTTVYSARPMSYFSKSVQSTVKRPYQMRTTLTNKEFCQKVNTAKGKVNTARPKAVNTARPNSVVVNAVRENKVNAIKASACWVWRPTKLNSAPITFKRHNYVDARGRSKHMTGNMSYLSDLKEFDGGYVSFGGGAKEGRITGKGTLKTSKLDFKDVLLKVPRKNNMYNVDMKNIVPKESLTCLVAKATLDESMLWHRRLGHVNFKTINKLVRDNLVKGLPIKRFENDQTCVACLKGKQHKASSFKDETSAILKSFITQIENLIDKKVKIIRCDNGTKFKNRVMSEFCKKKGIKREFSVARTPQKNGLAERRNRTQIEAVITMLADSKLPTTFWAEAVNTACYVQNRVLVVKPHNKTPYELFRGRTPSLSFLKPFGCHVTILHTLDHLGKFDGKCDDGFFVGYSLNSKAFRVYKIRSRKVEENLNVRFLEDKPTIAGDGPKWLFDIDALTKSMNYVPVVAGTNSNDFVGTKESIGAGHSSEETGSSQDYILMPLWKDGSLLDSSSKDANVNTAGPSINTASINFNTGSLNINTVSPTVHTASLESTYADFFGDESKLDLSNIATTYLVPTTPDTRIHKDHSLDHVLGDVQSGVQTRRMINEQGFISVVYEGKTHEDLHTYLFSCFLSEEEPKKVIQALKDLSWIKAMQEELLQFTLQQVWTLVDLPYGKRAIGTKWVYRNKKDERVARIEAIRLFLAYASFKDFVVYQIDVKSAFLYGKIEEVYVCQPPGFEDPEFPNKVYKVEKALYGLHQAPRAWYETLSTYLLDNGFQRVKTTSTHMETLKPLLKDAEAEDVDVYLYRSMIGSLMYLTASRPNIMFDVCSCARFQVTPKFSHLYAVKRIFRYLKGQPKLCLWYPKDSPFDLEAYTDSDYAGASLDRKSTTGGCEFLGRRLILWQCKKQTIVANSTTESEYVATASCCGQTATVKTVDNGEQEITATVDGKEFTITEASVRRHLQLSDVDGTDNAKITRKRSKLDKHGHGNG
ncbi:zinc finger BED domain-containing protein RICESLEEPER 2-like protein [Tanacetum coccineum]